MRPPPPPALSSTTIIAAAPQQQAGATSPLKRHLAQQSQTRSSLVHDHCFGNDCVCERLPMTEAASSQDRVCRRVRKWIMTRRWGRVTVLATSLEYSPSTHTPAVHLACGSRSLAAGMAPTGSSHLNAGLAVLSAAGGAFGYARAKSVPSVRGHPDCMGYDATARCVRGAATTAGAPHRPAPSPGLQPHSPAHAMTCILLSWWLAWVSGLSTAPLCT